MLYSLIEHKDLTNYITSLPKAIIEKIFTHPTTCLAVFRELPELAKIIVTRLVFLNQEVLQDTVNSWVNLKYKENANKATSILTNLGILQDKSSQGGIPVWVLKPSFRENLFQGIFKGFQYYFY
jgi:transcription initiation factor TFIIH subunit 4